MFEIGRLCVKLAGRDAGKKCVIVDNVDKNTVVIDGETRRKNCNIIHLEPLNQLLKIKKNASHQEVLDVLSKEGIKVRLTKPKKATERPKKQKIIKEKLVKESKSKESLEKKADKKEAKPEEKKKSTKS